MRGVSCASKPRTAQSPNAVSEEKNRTFNFQNLCRSPTLVYLQQSEGEREGGVGVGWGGFPDALILKKRPKANATKLLQTQ